VLRTTVTATREGKYLVFKLGEERYGIPIMDVLEIIGLLPITSMAKAPPHVKGIINLRGKVIPVIDLRLKFNMPAIPYNERTCIVIVEIAGLDGSQPTGIIVDAVHEVSDVAEDIIQDTPEFNVDVRVECITGIAKLTGGVTLLLDIERVFAA
jgi:purine-binding chemotaxis protein CheW